MRIFLLTLMLLLCWLSYWSVESALLYKMKKGATFKPWSNNTIYYFNELDNLDMKLQRVMRDIESQVCVKFINKKTVPNYRGIYVRIYDNFYCYSTAGEMNYANNEMSFGRGCGSEGTIKHEFAHLLGMLHEQQRPDAGNYIQVTGDVDPFFYRQSFVKFHLEKVDYYDSEFDFDSITLYDPWSGVRRGGYVAWEPVDPSFKKRLLPTVSRDFSFWDIRALNKLYKCADRCVDKPPCKFPNFVNEHCKCVSRENYADERCVDKPKPGYDCKTRATGSKCYNNYWVSNNCRKTCGACYRYKNHGTAQRGSRCADLWKSCPKYAGTEECLYHVKVQAACVKSCGLKCYRETYRTPFDDCKDNSGPYWCRWIQMTKKCRQKGFIKCRRTCGYCRDSHNPQPIPKLPSCRNYRDDLKCDNEKNKGKCNDDDVKLLCQGSCGLCGKDYPRQKKEI